MGYRLQTIAPRVYRVAVTAKWLSGTFTRYLRYQFLKSLPLAACTLTCLWQDWSVIPNGCSNTLCCDMSGELASLNSQSDWHKACAELRLTEVLL